MIYRTDILLTDDDEESIRNYYNSEIPFDLTYEKKFSNDYIVKLSITSNVNKKMKLHFKILDTKGSIEFSTTKTKIWKDLYNLYSLKTKKNGFLVNILSSSNINKETAIDAIIECNCNLQVLNFINYWNYANFNNEFQFIQALFLAMYSSLGN